MNDYQYVKRISLEATKPNVEVPGLSIDRYYDETNFDYDWYDKSTISSIYRMEKVIIEPFYLCDWTIKIQTEYSDEYKKVAKIVGHDKAVEVLKALGK